MQGVSFVLSSPNFLGNVVYVFDMDAQILRVEFYVKDDKVRHFFAGCVPSTIAKLREFVDAMKKAGRVMILKEVDADLSFERFWKAYGNPAGKKKYTKGIWDKMDKGEQIAALTGIRAYMQQKAGDGTTAAYPSTYLNNFFNG